jgi:phosphohistidine phosphatase
MELFLLRHADANTEAASDDARRLSEKGITQAKKVARFCEAHGLRPELVLSSPIRRAHETACIVAEHLGSEFMTVRWAACGMHPETALDELRALVSFCSVMLVGHQPDFSQLAAHLLGLPDSDQIRIRKASLTCIEMPALSPGNARLQWSIPCRLM